jgi:nitroimidazol reductase NimA-like FMN-containing flavoprotein (pyridoxamine 5'-phosphate oxidase superfamily)
VHDLEEIPASEALALLATQEVGRLAVVVDRYPQVFPVNYRMDGHTVVFRTHAGTMLSAANHANVSFQVDHVDRLTRSGWSVLVQGMAEDITEHRTGEAETRAELLDVRPWAAGEHTRLVRVIPAHVSGRRIPRHHLEWATDRRGYI